MKRAFKIIIKFTCLLAMLQPVSGQTVADTSTAENSIRGKLLLTGGLGVNILGTLLQYQYSNCDYWHNGSYAITGMSRPMLVAAVDYGVGRRFSAGLSFGYQVAKVTVEDKYYLSAGKSIPYDDTWKRLLFAARGDFYFLQLERISMYAGVKAGYSKFSMRSERSSFEPDYTSQLDVKPLALSIQAHVGCNYFFTPMVGMNVEAGLGIGGPYLAEAGIVVKL